MICSPMASTAAPPQLLMSNLMFGNHTYPQAKFLRTASTNGLQVHASRRPQRPPPGVDTRIHWDNEDEGWVGDKGTKQKQQQQTDNNMLADDFPDLLTTSLGSHYEFLGVSPDANLEEIKVAYRKLSKEYHPDTTSLPLKTASEKFMKLREVYNVLSNEESRKFYDWTLLQEAASRHAEKMKMKLEDPREQELKNWESVPDMVDRLGGKNMKLSDQAVSAITIDVFIIIFSICCIIYVIFFKEPYYY
ncbi:NAD(P)H-quinone oxidoreductase subunit T, chloroplastic [Cajanus cajan]|nr:NAD(P)H-quinone oxidoreductase subunit T, chloroplastic [Cajanus cajan]